MNPLWEPEDADRLLWQAITLTIDAVISLRAVKQMFGQRAYLPRDHIDIQAVEVKPRRRKRSP